MSVLVSAFPPSKNLEMYLKSFISQNFDLEGSGSFLDTVVRYAASQLARVCKSGPRGRTMSKAELDQALVQFSLIYSKPRLKTRFLVILWNELWKDK